LDKTVPPHPATNIYNNYCIIHEYEMYGMYGMYGMLNGTAVELVEFIDATPINTPIQFVC